MADQSRPIKNTAFDLGFCLYKVDGTLITNPGTITGKISKDFGDYADISAITEEDSTYGQLKAALTATEMNADVVMLYIVDNTTGCVPFTCTIHPAAAAEPTAAAVADAVCDEALSGHTTSGTLAAVLALIQKLLRNKVVTNPSTGVMTVYDDDGTTTLFTANVYEDVAGTVPFDGTGANRRDRLA